MFEREGGREKETDSADEAVDSTQSGSLCLLISFKFDKIIVVNDLSFFVTDGDFCCNCE